MDAADIDWLRSAAGAAAGAEATALLARGSELSVLRQLGRTLEDAVRKVDIVARYGGEEFVLLLPETNSEGGIIFAERLRERIELERFELEPGRVVNLTVSIGIATFPSPRIASTEDLFARADEALYRAKSDGRNQVRI